MGELKPCPFCGTTPKLVVTKNKKKIECKCNSGFLNIMNWYTDIVSKWNTRPLERAAYLQALDDVMLEIGHTREPKEMISVYNVVMILGNMKSDYQKGKTE